MPSWGAQRRFSLRWPQCACPVFKQSCLESLRIKTSGKLQAQTSTSLSLKHNMSFYVFTHPHSNPASHPAPQPFYRTQPKWGLGTCSGRIRPLCPWHHHLQGLLESSRPLSLSFCPVAGGQVRAQAGLSRAVFKSYTAL